VILNRDQLEIALSQLETYQVMLETMRARLAGTNSTLFPQLAEGYLARIRTLESEVISYLKERPGDAPLTVYVAGPEIHAGTIKLTLATQLMNGLQAAIYQAGGLYGGSSSQDMDKPRESTGLRATLSLNLVATASGSFVLALDLAPRQLKLFPEYDVAASTVAKLIKHVGELNTSAQAYTGARPVLRGIRRISSLTKRGIEVISLRYQEDEILAVADVTPIVNERVEHLLGAPTKGERTVVGILIEINVEDNTCVVHPEDGPRVSCLYDEVLEDDLVLALRKKIEMAGQFVATERPAGHYRITNIERFRLLDEDNESS
jgi:hypothetical protein